MSNCVYKITNNINGKSYIGSTNNYQRRMKEHKVYINCSSSRDGYNYPIHAALRKYGLQNFTFEILLDNIDTLTNARQLEFQYKKELNTMIPNGYNVKDGTEGCTEKDIERMIEQMGTKCALVTPSEEIIHVYRSLREAARNNDTDATTVGKVCNGTLYSAKGKIFRLIKNDNEIIEIEPKYCTRYTPICGINALNSSIIYYDSIKSAAQDLQVTPNLISKCINGDTRYTVVKGYIWRRYLNNKIIENNLPINDIVKQQKAKYIYYNNEYKTLYEWCKIFNLKYDKVRYQIKNKNKSFSEIIDEQKNSVWS